MTIFRPTRRSLLPRRPSWTDNLLNFFLSGLQKLEQRAKKCTELRGEYLVKIPSLVAVACFLPGQAKDLSATPHKCQFVHHKSHTHWPGNEPQPLLGQRDDLTA